MSLQPILCATLQEEKVKLYKYDTQASKKKPTNYWSIQVARDILLLIVLIYFKG